MLPMIKAAKAAGADWPLVYGGGQRSSMAFLDELSADGEQVRVWPQTSSAFSHWSSCSANLRPTP